jgi:hypothetical protein
VKRGCCTSYSSLIRRSAHSIGITAAICPDGVLVTGKGSRFILSGTEELLDQIDTLTERIRALEQGLDDVWRETHPENEHPLLADHFRQIKTNRTLTIKDEERVATISSDKPVGRVKEEEREDLVEVMEAPQKFAAAVKGTLSVVGDNYNSTKYYGVTARTEVRLFHHFHVLTTDSSIFSGWSW